MPPLCPLACAVALLPVDFAYRQLVQVDRMQPLAPLFEESHPVLGRRESVSVSLSLSLVSVTLRCPQHIA